MKTTSGTFASQLSLKENLLMFHRSRKGILWKLCLVENKQLFLFLYIDGLFNREEKSVVSNENSKKAIDIY